MMAQEMFVRAEVDYRIERARSQFGSSRSRRDPRRWVPRRRTLHLPHGRRRPLTLA